jgi:sporulation protein YlmC with PRC-barrel domain
MQHHLKSLIGNKIWAKDGDLGTVSDFYFDDITWTIRYMVVETGTWLLSRKVLISLIAIGKPDWESKTLSVNLTCNQVRNSPDIDTQRPVYRQHEVDLHEYYLWPQYWQSGCGYGGTFGITPYPLMETELEKNPADRNEDIHLRSTNQVTGYHIHATDGNIGHVADFIVDDEKWALKNMVVDIGNWLPGKQILVSPKWIKSVNWEESSVYLNLLKDTIKNGVEFDPLKTL